MTKINRLKPNAGFVFFLLQYPSWPEINLSTVFQLLKHVNLQGLTKKKPPEQEGFTILITTVLPNQSK